MVLFCALFQLSAQDTTRLSMLFLGDIMQHDSQIADAYEPLTKSYNYFPCFQYIKPYAQGVDLAFGNLELTLAGPPYKGYPQFGAPDELLVALKDMGMDVLVTANNHCVDRGRQGVERTIMMLDSLDILHTGTFVDEVERLNLHPLLIEKNGFKLALLNYTFSTNGLPVTSPNIVNMIDKALIKKDMARARAMKTDAIIVFLHWGVEYQSLPSDWQKEIGKLCFDQGAMMVIGAHPHVIQPMEWRKNDNKLIAYSLGNFVSGQRKRYTDGGSMVRLELEKVKINDSTAFTGIDTATYLLEWVYRTADHEKNYYVIPGPVGEKDIQKYVHDSESRVAFKTFMEDSRNLLGKYNLSVPEQTSTPDFFIAYTGSYADTVKIRETIGDGRLVKIIHEGEMPAFEIGPFSYADALFYRKRLQINGVIRKK
jgi:poly-gamma-glutamate capsule biosynthesis protein CapA/YwtB (metallophosphatase superfamily)